jgi:hypothetical protein
MGADKTTTPLTSRRYRRIGNVGNIGVDVGNVGEHLFCDLSLFYDVGGFAADHDFSIKIGRERESAVTKYKMLVNTNS